MALFFEQDGSGSLTSQKIRPLLDSYAIALSEYMAELSRAQRLEDALKVKKERESILSELKGGGPSTK